MLLLIVMHIFDFSALAADKVTEEIAQTLETPPPPPPPISDVFIIFFDRKQNVVTSDGLRIARQAVDEWAAREAYAIEVIGYTDRSLAPDESQRLSKSRADHVADILVALGVPRDRLFVEGRGENDNRVPTEAGVAEAQNRRVEMIVIDPPPPSPPLSGNR